MVCTFFGHRECPELKPYIRAVLEELIIHHNVDTFLVGSSGQFDRQVRSVLKQLSQELPHIRYAVVLAYMPGNRRQEEESSDTMLPEEIERTHPKFAIDKRNRWMLDQADYVVTHICHSWGGAWKYAEIARKKQKSVYNIDKDNPASLPMPILQRILANDAWGLYPLSLDDVLTISGTVARQMREAGLITEESCRKARERFEENMKRYMD